VLVGFHERKSSYVADMTSCEVLPPHVSAMLVPLRKLVEGLSIRDRMPQIELAVGSQVTALVLRVLEPINAADEALLRAFADEHKVQFWLQPKGPDTVTPFYPLDVQLDYTLPEFGIRMPFKPTDFTQVNHQINRVLVGRALRLLAPSRDDRVLDLFCGIGNFTLPLARLAREVMGIEGSEALTTRALANARERRRHPCARRIRQVPNRSAARRGAGGVEGAGRYCAKRRRAAAEADRVRVVQPVDARARRRPAGA